MSTKIQSYQSYKLRQQIVPYVFLAPNLLIFSIFIILPALTGLFYSFTERTLFTFADAPFIGLANYVALINDEYFIKALWNIIRLVAVTVPSMFVLSLFLAVILTQPIRAIALYRSMFYWPVMISPVVVGIIWQWMLAGNFSLYNMIANQIHNALVTFNIVDTAFTPSPTMANQSFAWMAVVASVLWSRAGYYMIIFLAALLSIPRALYEAADIDGASKIQQFIFVTFPSLSTARAMVLILVTMEIFRIYPLIVTLTGGGPFRATEFTVQYIYEMAFRHFDVGLASAMAFVMLIITTAISGIIFFISKKGENV